MTKKDFKKTKSVLEEQMKEICKSRESAKDYLISLGIYNPDGSLTKEYGGAYTRTGPDVSEDAYG